jgi:hypothetical protein
MDKKKYKVDPDFVAKRVVPSKKAAPPVDIKPQIELVKRDVAVPDYFDEEQLGKDLAQLAATPSLFQQYADRAHSRFTKKGQRAILNHYIRLYQTGQQAVNAKAEFERAKSTYQQLAHEDEIKRRKKDKELAQLDADIEEEKLRKANAAHKRKMLGLVLQPEADKEDQPNSQDEIKMKAREEYERRKIAFKVRLQAGEKFHSLVELQKWKKEMRSEIKSLHVSEDEENDLLDQIDLSYNEYSQHIKNDTSIYEEV